MFACLHLTDDTDGLSPEGLRDALVRLAECLSPDFEILRSDTAIVDLRRVRVATDLYPATPGLRMALARTPDLALLAMMAGAEEMDRVLETADFDFLPLEVLDSCDFPGWGGLLPLFRLWGLHTLGEIRRLPRQQVAERAGPAAMHLHETLDGRTCRPLKLYRRADRHVFRIGFEHPVCTLDALVFQSNRALQSLCAGLREQHFHAGKIRIRLDFEESGPLERSILLPEPLSTPETLLGPLQQALESLKTPSGITGLELELEPVEPSAAQHGFFERKMPQPGRWADTLARLEGLLGSGRVGIPLPAFSHRPDDFQLISPSAGSWRRAGESRLPVLTVPLRRFRPPREVAVVWTRHGGSPHPQALLTGQCAGPITGLRGPFPFSGDWWDASSSWQRLEWDIAMESRHLLRLVHLPPDRWILDGVYA